MILKNNENILFNNKLNYYFKLVFKRIISKYIIYTKKE